MELDQISPKRTVGPQISLEEIPAIAAAGFHAIICNRPDGQGTDRPTFEEIEATARAASIEAPYAPVASGVVKDEDVEAFGTARNGLQRSLLACYRTGNRSATLWSFHQAKNARWPRSTTISEVGPWRMAAPSTRRARPRP